MTEEKTTHFGFQDVPEAEKAGIDAKKARQMILSETNLIKRPVLDTGKKLLVGFSPETYSAELK